MRAYPILPVILGVCLGCYSAVPRPEADAGEHGTDAPVTPRGDGFAHCPAPIGRYVVEYGTETGCAPLPFEIIELDGSGLGCLDAFGDMTVCELELERVCDDGRRHSGYWKQLEPFDGSRILATVELCGADGECCYRTISLIRAAE